MTMLIDPRAFLPSAQTAIQHFHELGHLAALLFGISARDRVLDAGIHVVLQDLALDLAKRGLHGGDLGENVDAITLLADHARDASHLPLDPGKPLQALLLHPLLHETLVPPGGYVHQHKQARPPCSIVPYGGI